MILISLILLIIYLTVHHHLPLLCSASSSTSSFHFMSASSSSATPVTISHRSNSNKATTMSTDEQQRAQAQGLSEQEPLLGRVGDASQQADKPMYYNLVLGTAIIAQGGVWLLAGVIWGSVLSKKINLFAAHPVRSPSLAYNFEFTS